ncbi:MAG: thrombospondin type-1 domain-containing protein, partial [Candidatus Woesearchaeota archaeon]
IDPAQVVYLWGNGSFGECIACNNTHGVQQRSIFCYINGTDAIVSQTNCQNLPAPNQFQTCELDSTFNQTMFRKEPDFYFVINNSNARVQMANESIFYSLNVNFDTIFSRKYSASENPYVCTGDNVLFYGSGKTNAKVQFTNTTWTLPVSWPEEYPYSPEGYEYAYCYGDLQCQVRVGLCRPDERAIVSVSGFTNAKVESPNRGNYPYRLCCTTEFLHNPAICQYME